VADMVKFVRHNENPELYQQIIQASDRDLREFSPVRHDSRAPIRAMRAVRDSRFMNRAIGRWDRRDRDVVGVTVPGEHLADPDDPGVYRRNARGGLAWLARSAGISPAR
jgi:hypothetical protein